MPPLDTDEGKVSQILRNFISNALKFTERGEVRVWATADPAADTVTFRVRDTGIGIAEGDHRADLPGIRPGRASRCRARVKGTGLGLPLSKKLAELLGGRSRSRARPAQGSVFSRHAAARLSHGGGAERDRRDWSSSRPRSDPGGRGRSRRCLRARAHPRRFALSGAAARSIAQAKRALEQRPAGGDHARHRAARRESWRLLCDPPAAMRSADIPVIVVSSTGDERKALHLGADDYLAKPIDRRVAGRRRSTG